MGQLRSHAPVLPLLVTFSAFPTALDEGIAWMEQRFGSLQCISPRFPFTHTDYYDKEMGNDLHKVMMAPNRLMEADELVAWKLASNAFEQAIAARNQFPCPRPLNLDPGYLNLSKLVLASTKDHAHRLYLGQGIFAELTLSFRHGAWQPHPWTYPDFREPLYHSFLNDCRSHYRQLCREYGVS